MSTVSKAIAMLLLLVFIGDTTPLAFSADSESNLPPCCRRNGKHHCAMMDTMREQSDASGPAVGALQKRCASFPVVVPGQNYSKTFLYKDEETSFALIFSQPAGPVQSEARFRLSFSRASQKRGPPTLL